jgi:hypothetical protein
VAAHGGKIFDKWWRAAEHSMKQAKSADILCTFELVPTIKSTAFKLLTRRLRSVGGEMCR